MAATAAAEAGHWDCLEYANNNGALLYRDYWYVPSSHSLAERLARSRLVKLFPEALAREAGVHPMTMIHLAHAGHWQYVQLCLERGALPTLELIVLVARNGDLAKLELIYRICSFNAQLSEISSNWLTFAEKIGLGKTNTADVAQSVASAQQWDCLRFLITHGCPMNKTLTTSLLKENQLELYHLATAHGCEASVQVACQFAKDGNLVLLEHALEHGRDRSGKILQAAARHGQLQCLKYAHDQGCSLSCQVALEAARGGHLECLQYLHEHGCPWDSRVLGTRHEKCILDYANAHGCPF